MVQSNGSGNGHPGNGAGSGGRNGAVMFQGEVFDTPASIKALASCLEETSAWASRKSGK